ncbi:DUF4393 domain-containing protein [Paenibacillus tuaregi]|uniref:DUF4393 domain-containing protein n=1 Tax=Paenibacillus tuaregi TaxID=1816681 RepID=UPI0008392657|nr:DUF4393 domain-containing protein [Paenibacillus tuaregi]
MDEEKLLDIAKSPIETATQLAKNTLEPASKELGEGLSSIFNLVFSPLQKLKIKKQIEIERYKDLLLSEVSKIPPAEVIDPQLNIVGPALEASKYYVESDTMKKMFSKLIAKSVTKSLAEQAHPAFVEIIKQLSPLDAKALNFLFENRNKVGSGSILLFKSSDVYMEVYRNYFPFPDLNESNHSAYGASIDNLIRLGLLYIDTKVTFTDDAVYDSLYDHSFIKFAQEDLHETNPNHDVALKKTYWELTKFGRSFCNCCIKQ